MNKDNCKVCNAELEAPNANYDEWHCCKCIEMIKPKHTKGKWVVSPRWNYRKGISAKDTTKNEPDEFSVISRIERKTLGGQVFTDSIAIAAMQTYSDGKRPMDEVQANANLIASAPEMLKALKMVVDYHDRDEDNETDLHFENARDAIAKAEGSHTDEG